MKKTILYHLIKNNIHIKGTCNGLWGCTKCKIKLTKDFEIAPNDLIYLTEDEINSGFRLACEHYIEDNEVSDILSLYYKNLNKDKEIPKNVQILSDSFVPNFTHSKKHNYFGIALDIGTTTMAMNLVDLSNTLIIASTTATNPQMKYGFDIMSRIAYTMQNKDGLNTLHTCLVESLNYMIKDLIKKSGINSKLIKEFISSSNTCMCHILLNKEIKGLGKSPYTPIFTESIKIKAVSIGLDLDETCILTTLPHISAFIGSDIVSGIYTSKLYKENSKANILFIDIGTNGEMLLKSDDKLIASSCAVGPALEGMNISCGCLAVSGAIDKFFIKDGEIQYTTIEDEKAIGICGSGVLSILNELLKNKLITNRGNIIKKEALAKENNLYNDFISYDKNNKSYIDLNKAKHIYKNNLQEIENKTDINLYFSGNDIRQVQLSKAAILSGILCLLKKANIAKDKIDTLYIAGQFGKYISKDILLNLSIIPKEFKNIEYLGNTSLTGAYLYLLDNEALNIMNTLSKNINFFELSKFENYERIFAKALNFDNY